MFKKIFKIIFAIVFVIIFVIVFAIIAKKIFYSIIPLNEEKVQVTNEKFVCQNDPSIGSRAYIFVRGFGDHDIKAFDFQRQLLKSDIKTKDTLDFDYDEKKTLGELSDQFVTAFTKFAAKNNVDEIIILAESAGGIIASNSTHRFDDFDGRIEIHTLASPLRGYNIPETFVDNNRVGFGRDIALGLDEFEKAPNNTTVFHHKTIEDSILQEACGKFAKFCDPVQIQNNNLERSKIYFYPEEDHSSIVETVSEMVISCKT